MMTIVFEWRWRRISFVEVVQEITALRTMEPGVV